MPVELTTLVNVALRKESVDRNRQNYECFEWIKASLSARRAWIEMDVEAATGLFTSSLSARRAWIEIKMLLRDSTGRSGRSPQGERG